VGRRAQPYVCGDTLCLSHRDSHGGTVDARGSKGDGGVARADDDIVCLRVPCHGAFCRSSEIALRTLEWLEFSVRPRVGSEVALLSALVRADRTLVRLVVDVGERVSRNGTLGRRLKLALLAGKRLDFCVCSHVCCEVAFLGACVRALLAFVRFGTGMDLHVPRHGTPRRGAKRAGVAREGLFVGVGPNVGHQVALLSARVRALIAFEGLVSCVRPAVCSKGMLRSGPVVTLIDLTPERRFG
jgi:hypothetical protein